MKPRIRLNEEYSRDDMETMRAALRLIIKRAERGLLYGPDMPSSTAVCLDDISAIVERGFNPDEVFRLSKEVR